MLTFFLTPLANGTLLSTFPGCWGPLASLLAMQNYWSCIVIDEPLEDQSQRLRESTRVRNKILNLIPLSLDLVSIQSLQGWGARVIFYLPEVGL